MFLLCFCVHLCASVVKSLEHFTTVLAANFNPGADVVSFDISPRHSLKTIVVPTDLLQITEELTINGWSHGGFGYDGPPLIELHGNSQSPFVPAGRRRSKHARILSRWAQ